uniref:Uncharacterized protein n=1 Tax=Arundo donax TaxID=35708 RepID=A0A0A8YBR2_ARUDO
METKVYLAWWTVRLTGRMSNVTSSCSVH